MAKQPRPNLAVEEDWPADVARVHNEAAAARTYGRVIREEGLDARVPRVCFEDEREHVIGLECAPPEAASWKRELLDGRVNADVARAAGGVLGAAHAKAAGNDRVREAFHEKRPFEQLRISPYHRATAERNPDVAGEIEVEIERTLGVERTLVHGDYSPKNVLVCGRPWILDFEVAHWGDPAFDTAFMLNHLFIKSVYNEERHRDYVGAARAFFDAYRRRSGWDVEAGTVAELPVLMLARIDGKSPVEYVAEGSRTARILRSASKRALRGHVGTLGEFAALLREEVADA